MSVDGVVERVDRLRWFTMEHDQVDPAVIDRCTTQAIQEGLRDLPDVRVTSAEVNQTGLFAVPPDPLFPLLGYGDRVEEGLPDYCQVSVSCPTPGGHEIEVQVWVPLVWNGRFIGCGGGGNRLSTPFLHDETLRLVTLPLGIRNGFAVATSDGGYGADPRMCDWHINSDTGEFDWELIENWVHRSTHVMTQVGKAVTAAIHDEEPRWSYFKGTSGGGRQGVVQAQRYPQDYDGVWASDPAINWTRFIPAELWGPLVMKEHHALGPEKLNVFRQAALDLLKVAFPANPDPVVDASTVVGQETAEGAITLADAQVMQLIWDGPRTSAGERLWFGLLPGVESWGAGVHGVGLYTTLGEGDERQPVPFPLAPSWFGSWVQQDESFDWRSLTMETYAEWFQRGVDELSAVASDNPDFSGLRDSGNKLLITHGTDDQVIFPQGTVQYYDRVVAAWDGPDSLGACARLFICPGDGHSSPTFDRNGEMGAGLDVATGMAALMRWVEADQAPDELMMHTVDAVSGDTTSTVVVPQYESPRSE